MSLPRAIPLVILRGSGETTRRLARVAALEGVRVLAHAEGGGVLYVDAAADPGKTLRLVEASLDRLGVCNRLNLLLVHRDAVGGLAACSPCSRGLGSRRTGPRGRASMHAACATRRPLGHEWANDAGACRLGDASTSCADLAEAVEIANTQVSGLAAASSPRMRPRADAFLDFLPRHRRVLECADEVHRRVRADRGARDRNQRRLRRPAPAAR